MNWLDIVIVVTIAIATLIGLKIGLIKAVLSLAGLIIGVILARLFYVPLSDQLTFITQPTIAKIVAFAIILIGVMVLAGVLAMVIKWFASAMMLGWVNRAGGAVFGFVVGAIIWGALLALWVNVSGAGETIASSSLADILLKLFSPVLGLLPGNSGSPGPSL